MLKSLQYLLSLEDDDYKDVGFSRNKWSKDFYDGRSYNDFRPW